MIILPINAILQGQSYTRPQVDAALALKQNVLTFDDTPTDNSNNPVKSGGIKTELDGKLPIAENQENAPIGYVLTKTSTGSQWQRASSEGGTIAAAANSYPVTLLASDWEDHTYAIPRPQNATITADCDGILGLAPNASAAQVEAFQLAKIVVTGQDSNGVTVVARGQVPTINLNLELTLFMKADYYTRTDADALLATKAPLGSPALTGTPTAPTAASGTSTTQLATTAFVQNHSNLYGVCSTAGGTAAKEVTIDYSGTLTLFTGLAVRVKFTNANSAATPTLNVNSTGAIAIKAFGTTDPNVFTWRSNEIVQFIYDGTNWIMQSGAATIGGVGGGILISSADDLNDIIDTGWYYWTTTTPTNCPTIYGYGSIRVERAGSNVKQTVFRESKEYTRTKYGPNAWPAWHEVNTTSLAADLSLHVNATSGNDSNDGLTTGTALKTINAAVAKIPKDTAGRIAVINLAAVQNNDTYAAASIDGFNGITLIVQKESSASVESVIVQGATVTNNAHSTIIWSSITFNAEVTSNTHTRMANGIFSSCVFDGARLNVYGNNRISNCTFRNLPTSTAIVAQYGTVYISALTIENTVSRGVFATSCGIVSVGTYNTTNNATTPYDASYSGRIFVGGRTYREAPGRVSLMTTSQGTQVESALTTINLSEDARYYSLIEISVYPGTTTDGRGVILIDGYALTAASSMYFPLVLNGVAGGVVRITKNGTSTTSFKIQATHPTYSVIRIESVYAINT